MFSKALFIGIDKYNSQCRNIKDLNGCVSDMELMKQTMAAVWSGLPEDTRVLINQQATTKRIMQSLDYLVAGLKPGQKVFMYYAGHGGQVPNVLPGEDDPEAYDQTLVPHDFSKLEPLLDDIIHSYFCRIPQDSQFVMILDSCHSGGMARDVKFEALGVKSLRNEGWASRSIGRVSRAEYSPGELKTLGEHKQRYLIGSSDEQFVLLGAAQPHELAWERFFGEKKHGIFTYHVCELFKEKNAAVTPVDIINHAYSKIKSYRKNQMPRLVGNKHLFNKYLFKTGE